MSRLKLAFLVIFCLQLIQSKGQRLIHVSSGKIVSLRNFKSEFVSPRNIDIWIPEDIKSPMGVLYMHDGQMLFDSTNTWNHQEWGVDETLGQLIKNKKIEPCIVVGIWNNNEKRHAEYFPEKSLKNLSKNFVSNFVKEDLSNVPLSDNYLKFIVEELKPYIDKKYKTSPSRKNTYIAGSSMGGLISLYALCEYPNIFGGSASLSTHWCGSVKYFNDTLPNAMLKYFKKHLPLAGKHRIYFDFGTVGLDSLYERYQNEMDAIMRAKKYSKVNWITNKFEGKGHSEKAWAERLYIPLEFLMK